jgi:hypothetical protein
MSALEVRGNTVIASGSAIDVGAQALDARISGDIVWF